MKLPIITTLAIAIGFFTITITEANIYKWKDANGQIHYASTPPKPSEKNIDLKKDFLFANKLPTASTKNIDEEQKKSQDAINKEPLKISNEKLDFCSKEKNNLKLLQQNSTVTWIENGKKTPLSGKMLEDKRQVLKQNIEKHCASSVEKSL